MDTGKILGDYNIETELRDGADANVFLGKSRATGLQFAIKAIEPRNDESQATYCSRVERLEREYSALSRFSHTNIVRAEGLHRDAEIPYLVLEYVAPPSAGEPPPCQHS